jgi:DNA-binding transcriptional MocR family regulator
MQESDAIPAWAADFVRGAGPRYMQIVGFIERAVASGDLSPGDRLPAQRRLADALRVDLTTVTRAYTEARRRNLLEAHGALGTYVAAPKVELTQMIDLSMNIPPAAADIDLDDLLKQGVSQVLMHTDADLLMTYHLGGGSKTDRAAGALWLAPMFHAVNPNRVVACPGAQSALAALILALTQPGDVIVAESLCYPGLRSAAEQLGRRVVAIDADADGMHPDALEKACREQGARLVYLNPTIQNPTTATMPAHRRRDIASMAARYGIKIIEDDPYWLLADDAPAPLAYVAPEHVYYVSTLSKCLTPGLRTAYVLSPDAQSQDRFLAALRAFVLMSTPLMTALVTQWIHDGSAARLLAGVRTEARARQALAGHILAGATRKPPGGIHVWHTLPSYWTSRELARAARTEGLSVTSSDAFYSGANPPNAIRISLGGVRDRPHLATALKKLAELLVQKPAMHREIIV